MPCPPDYFVTSGDEAAGAKYRKVALNGRPMPDEKPQHTDETDQAKEESYIDALSLRLNHSVTDIYIPLAGGELALSVRRNVGGEVWNNTTGLTPEQAPIQHPDQPFGSGWTSNLCPNVHIVQTIRAGDDRCARLSPTYLYVTDENGQTYKFIVLYTPAAPTGVFVALPSSIIEQDSFSCTLTGNLADGHYVFTKKHGTVLTFAASGIYQVLPPSRNEPDPGTSYEVHAWSRVVRVQDRFGAHLDYTPGPGLVPSAITGYAGPDHPTGQTITITLDGPRVAAVRDPAGNTITYGYDTASDGAYFFPQTYHTRATVTTPLATTSYQYEMVSEGDSKPNIHPPPTPLTYTHVNLTNITDPNGNTYSFTYDFDVSKSRYDTATGLLFAVNGEPRRIVRVDLPDGSHTRFTPSGYLAFPGGGGFEGFRETVVQDAEGATLTYDFGVPVVRTMNDWSDYLSSVDRDTRRIPLLVLQTQTKITYAGAGIDPDGNGVEIFNFNPNAGMALARLQDLSGNVTLYEYHDPLPSIPTVGAPLFGFYADPNVEYRPWSYNGGTSVFVSKKFSYGVFRIMSESIDELGRRTVYDLDSLGRRTAERIYPPTGGSPNAIQETLFHYDAGFPGFLQLKAVKRRGDDEAWVTDLVHENIADFLGRNKEEIVNPGVLALTTSYTYDLNNNKLIVTDPKNQLKVFTYDESNRIVRVDDAAAGSKRFTYDLRGNKITEIDENGHMTTFSYDALNRLITQTRLMPGSSGSGGLSTGGAPSATNLVTRYNYNRVNSRTLMQDPNSRITRYQYDVLQRLTVTVDAANQSTTYAYAKADNPGASAFDSSHFKPTRMTDPRGVATKMRYDTLYRLREKSVEYATGLFSVVRSNTDKVGNVTEQFDPLGNIVTHAYDAMNRLTVTTYTNQTSTGTVTSTEQRFYTGTGLLREVIDELGHPTDTQYDGAGRTVKVIGPEVDDGTGTMARPTTQTIYDDNGNVTAKIDPRGNQTDFEYDVRNRKVIERRPAVVDATTGDTVRPEIVWTYDNVGNVTGVQDERGNVTNSIYDNANRVVQVLRPSVLYGPSGSQTAQPTTTSVYDRNGNVLEVTDPNGNVTTNLYDPLNRLISTTNGENITVTYEYDKVGNRIAVRDGKGQTTTMAYDGLNRLTRTTDPAGFATTLAYDALNKTSRTDASGLQVTQYTYNIRNRLVAVTYVDRPVDDRTLAYDFLGQLLAVREPSTDGQADVDYLYDAMRRVVSETSSGQTHTYLYDLAGNRLKVTYGGTVRVVASAYDALNRLLVMSESGRDFHYGYDLHGNIVKKTMPNGETVAQSFDALNRVLTIEGQKPSFSGLLYRYSHRYDLAGNVVHIREDYQLTPAKWREITQGYDRARRLVSEHYRYSADGILGAPDNRRDIFYTYDAADNRILKEIHFTGTLYFSPDQEESTYNVLNQLAQLQIYRAARCVEPASTRTVTYGYDHNGNRISRTEDTELTGYEYDYEQRLVKVTSDTLASACAYTYDYRTRRVGIVSTPDVGSSTATTLSFSGGLRVQEYVESTLDVEFIRGPDMGGGIGGLLYSLRGGLASFTHYNNRGDVVAKTDTGSTLTYQAAYEAYGTRSEEAGSTLDPQKANTKDEDPTGLLNEGFRYRDLETGEFITRDPVGFVDGPNFYTYVRQNPWTMFDPEGLQLGAFFGTGQWAGGAIEAAELGVRAGGEFTRPGISEVFPRVQVKPEIRNAPEIRGGQWDGAKGMAPKTQPPIAVYPAPSPKSSPTETARQTNQENAKILYITNNFEEGSSQSKQLHSFVSDWNYMIQVNGGQLTTKTPTAAEKLAKAAIQDRMRRDDPQTYSNPNTVVGHVPDLVAGGHPTNGPFMALDRSVNSSIGAQVNVVHQQSLRTTGQGYTYNEVRVVRGTAEGKRPEPPERKANESPTR